jgi:hypothetical protein
MRRKEVYTKDARRQVAAKEKKEASKEEKPPKATSVWEPVHRWRKSEKGKQAIVFMIVLTTFWVVLWAGFPSFLRWREVATYYVLAAIGMMVIDAKFQGSAKKTVRALMFVIFAIVGMSSVDPHALSSMASSFTAWLHNLFSPPPTAAPPPAAPLRESVLANEVPRRCDGKSHTLRFTGYQPGRSGCSADWNISDESPSNCVIPLGPTQQPLLPKPLCKGKEMAVEGMPITGWASPGGEVWITVTYN